MAIDDVFVEQLQALGGVLVLVVLCRGHLLLQQPRILPDLLQGVVLQEGAILKHRHQQVLGRKEGGREG